MPGKSTKPNIQRKRSAWLIYWEASTEQRLAHIKGPKVLAFIDPRRSRSVIREMVFAVYFASNELTASEKLSMAMNREQRKILQQMEDAVTVRCGFNPWVAGRLVENIEIESREDGSKGIRWWHPVYVYPGDQPGVMPYVSHYYLSQEVINPSAIFPTG